LRSSRSRPFSEIPSRLRDSPKRRERAASRAFGDGAGWASRLYALGSLAFVRVGLHDVLDLSSLASDPANIYRVRAVNRIRNWTFDFVEGPFYCKLEFDPLHGLHLHLVLPSAARFELPNHTEPVNDLAGLVAYLSKPPDARIARSKRNGRKYSQADKLEAVRLYNAARANLQKRAGKSAKLPRLSWSVGIRGG
jgi:hypothetical protein